MHRVTKLLILLVVVFAVAVVLDKTVGLRRLAGGGGPGPLSAADRERLASLQGEFRRERAIYLHKRDSGAPKEEVDAQEAKASKIADEIMKLGGVEAMQAIGRAPELRRAGGPGMRGRMGGGEGPPGGARRGAGGPARGMRSAQPSPEAPPPGGPVKKPASDRP